MVDELRSQIRTLREEISDLRDQRKPTDDIWEQMKQDYTYRSIDILRLRKSLVNKDDGVVKGVDFGKGSQLLTLTAGAKAAGSIVIWNIDTGTRDYFIGLSSSWILTAKVEGSEGKLIGAGGLENQYSIYRLSDNWEDDSSEPIARLLGHQAVLQDSCFIDPNHVLTASYVLFRDRSSWLAIWLFLSFCSVSIGGIG